MSPGCSELMIEDPVQLLGRLRLSREEYCQRLLTTLILAGPYPRWNSRSRPSEQGTRFLRGLDALSFGRAIWDERPLFVDEFDLPKRHEWEAGNAPDYALLWDDRVWMVELKTEKASHRPAQLPGYFELADHHYPTSRIDLTYLTPSMPLTPPPIRPRMRFAHVTWEQVVPIGRRGLGQRQRARATSRRHAHRRARKHRQQLDDLARRTAHRRAPHRPCAQAYRQRGGAA